MNCFSRFYSVLLMYFSYLPDWLNYIGSILFCPHMTVCYWLIANRFSFRYFFCSCLLILLLVFSSMSNKCSTLHIIGFFFLRLLRSSDWYSLVITFLLIHLIISGLGLFISRSGRLSIYYFYYIHLFCFLSIKSNSFRYTLQWYRLLFRFVYNVMCYISP